MSRIAVVSVCQLHQQALDFEGNLERIEKSIQICINRCSALRIGPELEICGYSCDDHFFEDDTVIHSYEIAARILSNPKYHNIVIDLGLPVIHKGSRYNCRMICLNGQILLIRPKKVLANDGCYSEWRWFACWQKEDVLDEWVVHPSLFKVTQQRTVPIGIAVLQFNDTVVGHETCEELFIPDSVHQNMVLNGAEIVCNSSGSHFVVGKLKNRLELVRGASKKGGCLYLYSNLIGCDAGRMYFDGGSFIHHRGLPIKMLSQHKLPSLGVEVGTSAVELEEIRSDRASRVSWMNSACRVKRIPKIYVSFDLCKSNVLMSQSPITTPIQHSIYDDLVKGPSCWLWSFGLKSHFNGFLLPLSGGMDSTAVGVIIYELCNMLFNQIYDKDNKYAPRNDPDSIDLLVKLRSITKSNFTPSKTKDIVNKMLTTVYLPNESVSTHESKFRAEKFAEEIGSNHLNIPITSTVDATLSTISKSLNKPLPRFLTSSGSPEENIALQNAQARIRMMLIRTLKNKAYEKFGMKLLILGTGNADEAIRGYLTKYDCSAADINPIGSLGKDHITQILQFSENVHNFKSIAAVLDAPPSAELVPFAEVTNFVQDGHQKLEAKDIIRMQTDEQEMGITYESLNLLRHIRKSELCGPRAMFRKLTSIYLGSDLTSTKDLEYIKNLAILVKTFFSFYARNRHKTTCLPPSVHLHDDSVDDNRYDMRPFLYNPEWSWQFAKIDEIIKNLPKVWINCNQGDNQCTDPSIPMVIHF